MHVQATPLPAPPIPPLAPPTHPQVLVSQATSWQPHDTSMHWHSILLCSVALSLVTCSLCAMSKQASTVGQHCCAPADALLQITACLHLLSSVSVCCPIPHCSSVSHVSLSAFSMFCVTCRLQSYQSNLFPNQSIVLPN